jgi:D-alanine--poly(phosphoribitol) ligase subunit 2
MENVSASVERRAGQRDARAQKRIRQADIQLAFRPDGLQARRAMTPSDKIIEVLKSVSETDEVQKNLDLPLYDLQILDSLKTVRLIVAISQEFGLDIPPSEFERERWATPRRIVADIENRIGSE